jgi:hypothetical protein
MTRKKPVVRETKLRVFAAADHERIVLIECEISSGLRARDDMQCYAHFLELYGFAPYSSTKHVSLRH